MLDGTLPHISLTEQKNKILKAWNVSHITSEKTNILWAYRIIQHQILVVDHRVAKNLHQDGAVFHPIRSRERLLSLHATKQLTVFVIETTSILS